MDPATAAMLVSEDGRLAVELAGAEQDPGSFAAGTRMRQRFPSELAAAR